MAAFNLTAQINLRGPSNLNRVVSNIRRQLSTVSLNLNIDPNATRGIQTATSNVQALNTALQNANVSAATLNNTLRGLGSALGTAAGGTNSLNNGLNNIAQQVTRTQRNTQQAALTMEDFGRQSALAVRRFAAFSVSAGAIYGLTRAISSAYGEFINFNKELVRLQQVTGTTANGLKGITDEITRLSTGLGVASADLLTVSSTLAQAGLSATETKTALEALAKSSLAPSFDNLNDTVEGSIALMRQFGISANDLESSLGSVNAVAAAFAVESGDIIKAIQRTGGVFAAASKGVSQGKDALNEFIAVFTSVRQTTRESAETIATGLRTIFTRVQRGATIEALKEYGIVLTDLEGKFVGPYEAIRRLSEGLKSLDPRDLRFNQIVEELGGFRQIGKVIPLIQQFTVAQQALGVAQKGSGSLAEAAGIAQLSLANKITKVREEFITLIRDIGQSKSFQTFADVSLKLASALISVASSAKEVLPALTALAAIRAIPAIGQFVGGFGRGFTRRNKGGPIRGFAKGGHVPGSGSGDTVPAMLTPGEFVIRKKAVETIGLNNLQNMNKYASGGAVQKFANGGFVQKFKNGKEVKKIPFEEKIKSGMKKGKAYRFGLVGLRSGTKGAFKATESFDITTGEGEKAKKYPIQLFKSTFSSIVKDSEENTIERNIEASFANMIQSTVSVLSSKLSAGKQASAQKMQKILKGSPLTNVVGSVFEAALASLGSPYIDKTEKTKSMDFPLGLGGIAENFGIPGNIPTDATRTVGGSGKGTAQMKGQIKRFLGAVENKEFTKSFRKLSEKNKTTNLAGTEEAILANMTVRSSALAQTAAEINKAHASAPASQQMTIAGMVPSVTEKELRTAISKGTLSSIKKKVPLSILQRILSAKASGGSISSEDTVPALLTPGEFVINKKAAKRIGSSKLNKLNKADKIQGFNKGGAVGTIQSFAGGGDVQRFFVGGAVRAFTGLIGAVQQLTQRMTLLGRNIPSGGGWTGGTSLSRLTGGGVRDSRGSTMSTALLFIGPMIAESINTTLSKQFGQRGAMVGSAVSSGISGATVGAAFGPQGALIGGLLGLTAGILDAASAANEYTKAQNELTIESRASQLDKTFEKLSNQASLTAADLNSLGDNLNYIISLGGQNQKIIEQEAGGGFMGAITRYLSQTNAASFNDSLFGTQLVEKGAGLDTEKLSRDILANTKTSVAYTQRTIALGLEKGLKFDQRRQETRLGREEISGFSGGEGLPKLTEFDRLLALSSDKALDIARVEADIVSARESGVETLTLEKTRAALIRAASDAMKEQYSATSKVNQAIKAVVSQMELFAEASKNLSAIISRANAEFEESSRVRDIITGPGLGEARIAGPSRLNENVLSNMRAYSQQEVLSTIDTLSKNLGLDPEFTAQAKTSAVTQQTFERDLPKILLEAAQKQATGKFDEGTVRDEIRSVFKPIRELLKDEINTDQLDETINKISERLQKEAGSLQGKSYQEIVGSVSEFSQILEPLSRPLGVLQEGAKSFNDVIANTNNALNQYSSHIARIIDLENQAASIQLEGANSLRQTLGEYVLPGDLNKPFENTIDRLTSTRGPNGLIVPGTGTLDPDEIARRLAQANKELTNLNLEQRPADPKKAEEFADKLAKAKTAADRLSLAQQKLATDTTRASNALNRIRDLVQVREARRGGAEEILKNINNPEFMMDFVRNFGSFERVRGGQGTMMDIPAAVEMFNRRLQMIDPEKREDETRRFYQRIEEVMTRDVRRGGGGADPAKVKEFLDVFINRPDQDNLIKSAIDEYNAAIKTQSTATENMAKMMTDSSEIFYNKIIQAGIDFYNMVSGMRVGGFGVDNNPIGQAQIASTGGLIYANKGRLINFQPKGSDTVPAMLTPGEFVVNAKATKKNMGLLKAINGGKNKGFSRGGMVYLQGGGLISPEMRAILQDLYESPEIVTSSQDLGRTLSEVLETDGEAGLYNELKKHRGQPYGASADQSDLLYEFITKYEGKQRETEKEKFDLKQNKELETMAKDFGYDNAKQMKESQAEFKKQQIQDFLAAQELSLQDFDPNNNINVAQDRLSELRSGNVAQLTALEQDMFRKFKVDQQSKEKQRQIQEEYNRNMEAVQAAQSQINARKQLDDMARKEINPYTGKPFVDAAEKEGVMARQAFDARQKAIADAKAQERSQKKEEVNAGLETFIPKLLTQYQNSKYYTQTSDPFLRELVETDLTTKSPKILAQYLELQKLLASKSGENLRNDPNFESRWFDARLEEVVSSAKLDYWAKGRRRQEDIAKSQQEFANKNMEIALQQFGEGVDKSPILAAATAVPRNVPNVLRTVVGGAGVVAGGVTYAAGSLEGEDNFVTQFGKSLMESGGAQAGIGVEGMLQTGAGLGSRLGFGEAYDTAEKQAASRREALIAGEANKARGAYTTDPTTTIGQLLTPENVVRGAITAGDVFGEAAGDFVGVGGTLNRLSARVLAGGAKQAGKRSLSLGQRLARTNANMAKPRIMSPQDIADAEAAEAIINGIRGGTRSVGRGALKGSDLAEAGLRTARDLTTKAMVGGIRTIGRGASTGFDMAETGLMNIRDLTTKAIIGGTKAAGKGVLKRLGFLKDPDYYKLQQIKTAKAQRAAQKKAAKQQAQANPPDVKSQAQARAVASQAKAQVKTAAKPAKINYGRRIFGQKPGEEFIYRGSHGSSIEEGFDLTKMGSTGSMYGAGVYGGFDVGKVGQGKALAQQYWGNYLAKFIKENPGMTAQQISQNFKGGLYKLRLKQPELFIDANAPFKKTREADTINKLLKDSGVNPDKLSDTSTPRQAYEIIARQYKKQLAGLPQNRSLSPQELNSLARAKTSESFAKEGIPGMVAYENKTRYKGADGSGVVSIFDKDAFEIISKKGAPFEAVKKVLDKIKAKGLSDGGMIYASQGKLVPYQPKGTDTVPAMLTPGEFVVNAKATKKNLGLLKAINGGAKGYSKGGVAYLEDGGRVRTRKDLEEEIEAKRKEREEIESTAAKRRDEYRSGEEYTQDGMRAIALAEAEETASFRGLLASLSGGVDNENLNSKLDEFKSKSIARIAENIWDKSIDSGIAVPFKSIYEDSKQPFIDTASNIVNSNIDQFKASPWDYSGTNEEFQNKLDERIAHGSLIEYKLTDNAGEARPQPNVGGGYTSDANQRHYELGHEIKDSQDLLRDIDLLQDKPNAQNEARINYTSAKITLEDMGIDAQWFGTGVTTDEIKKGLESPGFEAKAEQNKARAIQQLKQRAEENLIANNIDWKEAKKEDPEVKAKVEAQAQQAEQKDNPQQAAKPTLSDAAKIALDSIRVNRDDLLDSTVAEEAVRARDNINIGLQDLAREGFVVDSSGISDILNAAQEQILEARNNQSGALQNFYDNNVLPVLGDLANQAGAQPPQPPVQPQPDPYAGMNQQAEYEASQKAKREAFRTRTGRDPATGRIGGPKVELTPEEKALNRKRAERLALAAIHPSERTEDQRERYQTLKDEWLAGLSPEQNANRDRAERIALNTMRPENRSAEQQERLDILKTPVDQRSPEQIARLEELRKEKEQALYASKGRLINFQPRGSDTVPAMLTPGEFVVNKRATKNNLGLLKQINSEQFNSGGLVQSPRYLAEGGQLKASSGSSGNGVLSIDTTSLDSALSPFNASVSSFSSAIGQFENAANTVAGAFNGLDNVVSAFTALSAVSSLLSGTATGLGSAIGTFNTSIGQLSTVLSSVPDSISLNVSGSIPVSVNVTVNGGEGLGEKLDTFKDQIYNDISAAISEATSGRLRINLNTSKR
jgi:hypothetical protein